MARANAHKWSKEVAERNVRFVCTCEVIAWRSHACTSTGSVPQRVEPVHATSIPQSNRSVEHVVAGRFCNASRPVRTDSVTYSMIESIT